MGTAHIVCTHCILGDMDLLPCTSPSALLTGLAQQVFSLTFPRVLGRGPRAVRKTLVGVCLDSRVDLDL